jgi:hypothetical protein
MEGAALKEAREYDLAIATAWHTAIFALQGYAGKLNNKKLSDYLTKKPAAKSGTAQAIAFFHALKAAGCPIEITRTPRKARAE